MLGAEGRGGGGMAAGLCLYLSDCWIETKFKIIYYIYNISGPVMLKGVPAPDPTPSYF